MDMEVGNKMKDKIRKIGGSLYVILAPEIVSYLSLNEDSTIGLQLESGKKGKYISFWKEETKEVKK